jgi:hypothetical protein
MAADAARKRVCAVIQHVDGHGRPQCVRSPVPATLAALVAADRGVQWPTDPPQPTDFDEHQLVEAGHRVATRGGRARVDVRGASPNLARGPLGQGGDGP